MVKIECNLEPIDHCNKTCCPYYKADNNWCHAFNKRTLEQLKETTQQTIDGMWFNIQDARNTIGQAEQYLAIIYELLIVCLDQIIKVSSSSARTEGDFKSASDTIKEYITEIYNVVGNSQYNGRYLLQDTTNVIRGADNDDFQAGESAYPSQDPRENVPHTTATIPIAKTL